jgi:hypothetical protein
MAAIEDHSIISTAIIVGICILFVIWKRVGSGRHGGVPFPPGPTPLPLIGNLRDIPTAQPWITYTQWKKKYGMFSVDKSKRAT